VGNLTLAAMLCKHLGRRVMRSCGAGTPLVSANPDSVAASLLLSADLVSPRLDA